MKYDLPERVRHSIVLLLETDNESMDIFDFILEHIDKALDRFLFFDQIVAKARCVNHREHRLSDVTQKVALILASLFGYLEKMVEIKI